MASRTPDHDPDDLIDDVTVVLLAGGSGERLESKRPKAFVGLAGQVMLAHSLRAFESHPAVDSIVIVVPDGWLEPTEVLVDDLGCDRVSAIEIGGATRAESVLNGLAAVAKRRATAVLVHDSARPVVPERVIDRVIAGLAEGWDAVIPGLPVTDTIKRVGSDGAVLDTPARESLQAIQTPQACRASVLINALEAVSVEVLAAVTDCAQAIEQAGGRVQVVRGDTRLGKITTAADLARFETELAPLMPPVETAPTAKTMFEVAGSGSAFGRDEPVALNDSLSDDESWDDDDLSDEDLAGSVSE